MPLHQFDYIFAIGVIFCLLDAYNIGANDVANSFATSVSSRSLTLRQAVLAAAVCEFAGAVLVGARVADTIKNGIISPTVFTGNPGLQLLSFTCAIVASATWLMIATRYSWPVSTTYSIISAVAGVGVAVGGADSVRWGWNGGKGMATIFAGMAIAPAIAGGFAAICYLIVKFGVLHRKDPVRWAIFTAPMVFFTVTAVLTLSIIYKGAPSLGLTKISKRTQAIAIVMTSLVVSILSITFWMPYVYAKVVKKDYTIRWYHFFMGPMLWRRPAPVDAGTVSAPKTHVPDYRIRDRDAAEDEYRKPESVSASDDAEKASQEAPAATSAALPANLSSVERKPTAAELHPIEGAWAEPRNLYILARYHSIPFLRRVFLHGSSVDIHALQAGKSGTRDNDHMKKVFEAAHQYPNEVEHSYSFLQVLTACTASFAHGANDVSNAIGPFAVIYHTWSTSTVAGSKSAVPVWLLAVGGVMIVLGLATYGYNIMKVLGNRITLHSPSRGFSMELGAALTVVIAAAYGIPVSTTMSITGATLGVALCNGDLKSVNWRALGWIVLGWLITVPVVGTAAGCLVAIIINAPRIL